MEKEIKRPRADRREIVALNAKFDSLLDPVLYEKALHGDTEEVANMLERANGQWQKFTYNHNKNKKNKLHADPGALLREVKTQMDNGRKAAEVKKTQEEKAAYDRWIAKTTLRLPRLMWRWKLIEKIKPGYINYQYEKLQGKSPRRA